MDKKTEKMSFWYITLSKCNYVGKVPKIIFEKLTQNFIIFEAFLVEKVPRNGVFNRECLENSKK